MTADEARHTVTEQHEGFLKVSEELPHLHDHDSLLAALALIGSHTLMTNLILVEVLDELESARHTLGSVLR